ncbi:unnamed protein product [Moneuplotes crassus]|uniref:Uncharacterized protein n=1 Tax=Euplotes crassus TaxID=5936 RepID=A0AAD1U915_EUPCR|nr:unnamed protein product [Moneuplotes crassus]
MKLAQSRNVNMDTCFTLKSKVGTPEIDIGNIKRVLLKKKNTGNFMNDLLNKRTQTTQKSRLGNQEFNLKVFDRLGDESKKVASLDQTYDPYSQSEEGQNFFVSLGPVFIKNGKRNSSSSTTRRKIRTARKLRPSSRSQRKRCRFSVRRNGASNKLAVKGSSFATKRNSDETLSNVSDFSLDTRYLPKNTSRKLDLDEDIYGALSGLSTNHSTATNFYNPDEKSSTKRVSMSARSVKRPRASLYHQKNDQIRRANTDEPGKKKIVIRINTDCDPLEFSKKKGKPRGVKKLKKLFDSMALRKIKKY